jgi:rubrerythrin
VDFASSRTAQNLLKAFAGESQARNRYTFAAVIARREGFDHIAGVFEETAHNEREHASLFYAHLARLAPSALEITASYPIVAGETPAQLRAAAQGEHEEWTDLYPEFARIAREEGFSDVARTFEAIARVEKAHEDRFQRLLGHAEAGTVFVRGEKILWRCRECGHVHEGLQAPKTCPVCLRSQGAFEPVAEAY